MKFLFIVVVAILFSPFTVLSQSHPAKHSPYKKFPEIYQHRDSLIRFITPDKNYTYWEYDDGGMDTTKDGTIIYSSGIKPAGVTFKDPQGSMLMGCLPAFCYKYIAYVHNGKVGYISSDKGLRDFMGPIDNLEKAVLLAEIMENLFPDEDKRGGSYLATAKGYDLILTNYILCPITKEAFRVTIDTKGIVKKVKLRAYSKSTDCAEI